MQASVSDRNRNKLGNTGPRAPGAFSPLPSTTSLSDTKPTTSRYKSHTATLYIAHSSSEDDDDGIIPQQQRTQDVLPTRRTHVPRPNSSTLSLKSLITNSVSKTSNGSAKTTPTGISPVNSTFSRTSLSGSRPSLDLRSHSRKHSRSQGLFNPSLPNTSPIDPGLDLDTTTSREGARRSVEFYLHSHNHQTQMQNMDPPQATLSASQIAAQAAMQQQNHQRKRSQTLPLETGFPTGQRRPSRGPVSPPLLSLTEASGERGGFAGMRETGQLGQSNLSQTQNQQAPVYRNGLLGGSVNAAATAANVVFAKSPHTSPNLPPSEVARELEKPMKDSKVSKVKLFSRPGKLSLSKETKEKPQPSPNKAANFSSHPLQRTMNMNMSTHSLADTMSGASSLYSLANSSTATIRALDPSPGPPVVEKQEKEKKHHFLSRQKHKLSSKDDHHLLLSSAASNSRPVDPSAPSSFYNFNLPPSPGPSTTSFSKTMSGLDLRHGGRALREKKREKEERAEYGSSLREIESAYGVSEWGGSGSLGSVAEKGFGAPGGNAAYPSSVYGGEQGDMGRYGLNNMMPDDAWPYLKAKLLVLFEGEDLKLPVEDFNRLVSIHIQRLIGRRLSQPIISDFSDLLHTGFSSMDHSLRRHPDERLIPHLVEIWRFTFTSLLPYLQAVFLPLDLEFHGRGPFLTPLAAAEFWRPYTNNSVTNSNKDEPLKYLSVRTIILTTFRDVIILPRYELLKTVFSRLSLESLNPPLHPRPPSSSQLSSSPPELPIRPGTAMSNLDPQFSSYGSQGTTLLNSGAGSRAGSSGESTGMRSRGVSNVSWNSDLARPFTPGGLLSGSVPAGSGLGINHAGSSGGGGVGGGLLGQSQRDVNAEDSKLVTETVGRLLQCMSVLASVSISSPSIPSLSSASGLGSAAAPATVRSKSNSDASLRAERDGFGHVEALEGILESGRVLSPQEKMEGLGKALKLNWLGRGRTGRNRRGLVGARVGKGGLGGVGMGGQGLGQGVGVGA